MQRMVDRKTTASGSNVDAAEVARFAALASEWWDPHGKFRPLHKLGPARLEFIRDQLVEHFGRTHGQEPASPTASLPIRRSSGSLRPLAGLAVLDIGCGGGLIAEPLARLGAKVTAIDPAEANIQAARAHAEPQGLVIDYRAVRVEGLAAEGARFDAVVCLEVIEHVPDVAAFIATCAEAVRPGGILIVSTLNRTLKSFALAIVGAEYVLRWLPVGTHQWQRFVTPAELERHLTAAGLKPGRCEGLVYNPLADSWTLDRDCDVNYLTAATSPEA